MELTILGNNSALPAFGRHPTSQLLQIEGQKIMIDCGEGAQIQMQKFGKRFRHLDHIFISHLHGDHYFGLPGLLTSMSLNGRTRPLHLFAPAPLQHILDAIFAAADTTLQFPLHFTALGGRERIAETHLFEVRSFPVAHRIPCFGFVITTKKQPRSLLLEQCQALNIPIEQYKLLTQGHDATDAHGVVVKNEVLTTESAPSKKYAFAADTLYTESFMEDIKGVDVLYHESTFAQADEEKAALRFHSTAAQAATLAMRAGVKQLLLGHFSSRYKDLDIFQQEAEAIFKDTVVTVEGCTYFI